MEDDKTPEDEETVTIRLLKEETGEEFHREEVPKSVIEKLDYIADYYGISQEEALNMAMEKALDCIEEVEGMEDDPVLKRKVVGMFGEALHEVLDPSWEPPEGMQIQGNPPLEAFALLLVKMRLHMSEHNN